MPFCCPWTKWNLGCWCEIVSPYMPFCCPWSEILGVGVRLSHPICLFVVLEVRLSWSVSLVVILEVNLLWPIYMRCSYPWSEIIPTNMPCRYPWSESILTNMICKYPCNEIILTNGTLWVRLPWPVWFAVIILEVEVRLSRPIFLSFYSPWRRSHGNLEINGLVDFLFKSLPVNSVSLPVFQNHVDEEIDLMENMSDGMLSGTLKE